MITFPNAKINLGLNIVSRRPDGYHDLETVFYPVNVTDVLEIVPGTGDDATLTCYGHPVDCPTEKNLVMKAYRLMQRDYGVPPVDMHLYKSIPDGAGLGGGSSDAAHVMTMLNEMFSLGIDKAELARKAATLGADCAFFIYNTPMMATGIGDVLTPVDVDLKGRYLLLVKPDVSVPTREAYSRVTPEPSQVSPAQVVTWPVEQWDGVLKNDFEPSVFAAHPELWMMKATMLEAGAQYACMSGSGSSIVGIFDNATMAECARDKFTDCFTRVCEL
ncbi:4-(cytidine 5'-diphospho)-2-C-methyl-D-erythritol kinase [Sodaliphilus sp.]|uniref:4-(cytidine 5'-diphospho)-2-C-methyl-D-erythritol kinase n=1 Tax=Sodaliphilus sp. TaxID=2815818 RepID=UPI00388D5FE1